MGMGGRKGGQIFNKVQLGWGKIKKVVRMLLGVLEPLSPSCMQAPPATRAVPFAFTILQQQLYKVLFFPQNCSFFYFFKAGSLDPTIAPPLGERVLGGGGLIKRVKILHFSFFSLHVNHKL